MRTRLDRPLKFLLAVALIGTVPRALTAQEQESSGDRQAQSTDQAAGDKDNKDNQSRSGQQDQQEQEQVRTVKAFDLEHVKPQEMLMAIQTISARQHQAKMNRQAREQAQSQREGQPQRTQVGFRPTTEVVPPVDQQKGLAVAVDEQSKTLFVRGTEEQVSSVEKLIEMFDTEAGNLEKQELDGVALVPVRQDNLQRITTVLNGLQLQTQNLRIGETAFLILPDDEKEAEQVEQVIARLKESSDSGQNHKQSRPEN